MSFLDRLKSELFPSAPKPPSEIPAVDAKTTFKGRDRTIEIVGEAAYQAELERIAGPKDDKGKNVWRPSGELIPETWNRKDPKAVMVRVDGICVGYLAAEHAAGYHRAMAAAGYPGYAVVGFKARIVGGWKRIDDEGFPDEGHYGVKVYIPEDLGHHIGAGERKETEPASLTINIRFEDE